MSEGVARVVPVLGNPEVIRVLEDALALARSGDLVAVGLVRVGARGLASTAAGGHQAELHLGLAMLQRQLLDALARPASPIVRVRP